VYGRWVGILISPVPPHPFSHPPKVYFCILVTCPVSPPVLAARTLHFLLLNPIHTYIYTRIDGGGGMAYPALLPRPQSRIPFCHLTPTPLSTTPRSLARPLLLRATDQPCLDNLVVAVSALYIYIIHYSTGPTRAASTAATIIVMLQEHFCRSAANGPDSVGEHHYGSRRGCDTRRWCENRSAKRERKKYNKPDTARVYYHRAKMTTAVNAKRARPDAAADDATSFI